MNQALRTGASFIYYLGVGAHGWARVLHLRGSGMGRNLKVYTSSLWRYNIGEIWGDSKETFQSYRVTRCKLILTYAAVVDFRFAPIDHNFSDETISSDSATVA